MSRLAEIEARISSMGELLEVIGAMRSLAGMRLQEAQHALPAASRYAAAISTAIAATLSLQRDAPPAPQGAPEPRAVVLYGAEHGFVGGLTDRLLSAATLALRPQDRLFVLGSRCAAIAAEHGLAVATLAPMATRPADVPRTVDRLTDELYRRIARGEVSSVELIYASREAGGESAITHRTVIPLDRASLPAPAPTAAPLAHFTPAQLLEQLTAEYVFALLAAAAIESLAGENAARFITMTAARENVTRKLDALHRTAGEVRQEEITTELLDVVTGAQAVRE